MLEKYFYAVSTVDLSFYFLTFLIRLWTSAAVVEAMVMALLLSGRPCDTALILVGVIMFLLALVNVSYINLRTLILSKREVWGFWNSGKS